MLGETSGHPVPACDERGCPVVDVVAEEFTGAAMDGRVIEVRLDRKH
jgi:hypothetical protein